jgi:hypothetical protein
MKNLILIITFSVSSMMYAQEYEKPKGYINDEQNIIFYSDNGEDINVKMGDTLSVNDTTYFDNGSIEYFIELKLIVDTLQSITGDVYYYNPSNQLEYIAHFNQGELLGHTIYEPLKPEENE